MVKKPQPQFGTFLPFFNHFRRIGRVSYATMPA